MKGIICACIPTLVPLYKATKQRFEAGVNKYSNSQSRRPSADIFMLRVPFFPGNSRKNSAPSVLAPLPNGSERKGSAPPAPSTKNSRSNRTERALMGKYANSLFSKFSYGHGSVIDLNEKFEYGDVEAQQTSHGVGVGALSIERATHSATAAGGPTPPNKVHVDEMIRESSMERRPLRSDDTISPISVSASRIVGRRTSVEVYYSDASSRQSDT